MMLKALLAVVLMANAAGAADYCGLTTDQHNTLPESLAGTWQATLRGAILVGADGKPQALPADDAPQEAIFTADAGGLALAEDGIFPAVTLAPYTVEVMSEPDFALPGESPMGAAELLEPQTKAAGLPCDPKTLPQYVVEVPMDGTDGEATLRLFALQPDLMVMVIGGKGAGQAARAVFDLHR